VGIDREGQAFRREAQRAAGQEDTDAALIAERVAWLETYLRALAAEPEKTGESRDLGPCDGTIEWHLRRLALEEREADPGEFTGTLGPYIRAMAIADRAHQREHLAAAEALRRRGGLARPSLPILVTTVPTETNPAVRAALRQATGPRPARFESPACQPGVEHDVVEAPADDEPIPPNVGTYPDCLPLMMPHPQTHPSLNPYSMMGRETAAGMLQAARDEARAFRQRLEAQRATRTEEP
jgi:hypothetical protein